MKILIVEDQINMVLTYRMAFVDSGHQLTVARDGTDAISCLRRDRFDAVVTDWMMPNGDGIGLIHWIRTHVQPVPLIVMVTSLGLPDGAQKAINAGADEYVVKPIVPGQLLSVLDRVESRERKQVDTSALSRLSVSSTKQQSFHAVAIAAGSGATPALERVLSAASPTMNAALLVVAHGPEWAIEALAQQLSDKVGVPLALATAGEGIESGKIYLAPGDRHMAVNPERLTIQLDNSEPENFVRPSADTLMRSVARVFGSRAVGVVLGGIGCDASIGSGFIHAAGGEVLVLDPAEAVVPQMLQHVIEIGMADHVLNSEGIIERIRGL